jgi:hypothetical protein
MALSVPLGDSHLLHGVPPAQGPGQASQTPAPGSEADISFSSQVIDDAAARAERVRADRRRPLLRELFTTTNRLREQQILEILKDRYSLRLVNKVIEFCQSERRFHPPKLYLGVALIPLLQEMAQGAEGRLPSSHAGQALASLLRLALGKNGALRVCAIAHLKGIHHSFAERCLVRVLKNARTFDAKEAALALQGFRSAAVGRALLKIMADPNQTHRRRGFASLALYGCGDLEIVQSLKDLAAGPFGKLSLAVLGKWLAKKIGLSSSPVMGAQDTQCMAIRTLQASSCSAARRALMSISRNWFIERSIRSFAADCLRSLHSSVLPGRPGRSDLSTQDLPRNIPALLQS